MRRIALSLAVLFLAVPALAQTATTPQHPRYSSGYDDDDYYSKKKKCPDCVCKCPDQVACPKCEIPEFVCTPVSQTPQPCHDLSGYEVPCPAQ